MELRLSDAFPEEERESCSLECRVTVFNINKGHNQELMAKSKRLSDYAYFVQAVRDNIAQGYGTEEAVVMAVDMCIGNGILDDILRRNRAEVINLFLTTYDAKLHKKAIEEEAREEGMEKGLAEGRAKGLAEGRAKGLEEGKEKGFAEGIEKGIEVLAESCHELGGTKEMAMQMLAEKYALSSEEAKKIVEAVWGKKND